jgi:hypothetical protein
MYRRGRKVYANAVAGDGRPICPLCREPITVDEKQFVWGGFIRHLQCEVDTMDYRVGGQANVQDPR